MHRISHRLTLAGVGLTAVLALGACGTDDAGSAAPGGMSPMTSSTSESADAGQKDDVEFAQMMIPHHQQAVEMADMALESASSAEVMALAKQIKAAQDPEIATMTGWLEEWKAPMSADGGHGGHDGGMMSDSDMKGLAGADGAAFDRMWLTMMIEHHEGAVEMAQDVLKSTADPDVKAMAEAVVAGQEKEIATMKALL